MLYFRANHPMKLYSPHVHDWREVDEDELLTDKEMTALTRRGFNVKYWDFSKVVTSQRNVKFEGTKRVVIDELKVKPISLWR